MARLPTLAYYWVHSIISRSKRRALSQYLQALRADRRWRVLELGCGPGLDAGLFHDRERFDYLGIDIDPGCIAAARHIHALNFEVGDVTSLTPHPSGYDIVLANSLLHHLNNCEVRRMMQIAHSSLAQDGTCLILDMIYPAEKRAFNLLNRALIRCDRGRYCRREADLEACIAEQFQIASKRNFQIRFGALLWDMRFYVCTRTN